MSYTLVEESVALGRPYFLYQFNTPSGPVRLTSDPELQSIAGSDWTPSPISHDTLEQSGNIEKAELELTFPLSDEFAREFLIPPPSQVTTVTIWRGHFSAPASLRVVWKGRVTGARSSEQRIRLTVESAFTSLKRSGLRTRYQRTCRHAVYFQGCNLVLADHQSAATVTAINGLELTVPEAALLPAEDIRAGLVTFNGLHGFVQSHDGSKLVLVNMIPGLVEAFEASGAQSVLIAPGCTLSKTRCVQLDNVLNFGGFPYMPDKNPFSSSIM